VIMHPIDVHWAKLAYRWLSDDRPAPTWKKLASYAVGDPNLGDTGAPPPIWCVHVALLRAHEIADGLGIDRVDPSTLAPRSRERERSWVDRIVRNLAAWASSMSSASENVTEASVGDEASVASGVRNAS
jgi:hypothetical protein